MHPPSDHSVDETGDISSRTEQEGRYSPSLYYSYEGFPKPNKYRSAHFDAAQLSNGLLHAVAQTHHELPLKRKRSVTPPFVPRSPSPSYIALSNTPPSTLSPPRKLLVLDLNGTLVFRPPASSGKPRKIHPRPYMNVFAQYVFRHFFLEHLVLIVSPRFLRFLSLRDGLDAMIWSSAQPHNVESMVDRAFGPLRRSLKHVWARDTLGLSQQDFCEFIFRAPHFISW